MNTLSINFDGQIIVPVRKTESDFTLDVARLSNDMLQRIFMYGVTQITNDCHASVKVSDDMDDATLRSAHEAVDAAIAKRWDAIYAGEWRVRTAGEGKDPVEAKAEALARAEVRAAVVAAKRKWADIPQEKRDDATAKHLAKHADRFAQEAKAFFAAKRAASAGVDLGELL